ncbi:MAG: hypothetical protein ACXADH_07120 [Candidatus Kariarchaeaceae archaeon]|jgi:hypothetical protein
MRYLLLAIILSCTEVSISKVPDKTETGVTSPIIDTIDTSKPKETAEPTVEPPSGIGGYIHYYLRQIACTGCVGEPHEISLEFVARFHEKVNGSYTDWIPPQGQCTNSIMRTAPTVSVIDLGPSIKAQSPGGGYIMATKDSQGIYRQMLHSDATYDRDAVYDLKRDDEYILSFNSFHGFDDIQPYELRYVDPSYAFAVPVYRSGATFWWAPHGSNSTFNITLAVYTPDGSSLVGYVSCSGADSGMMTIPPQYLSSFPYLGLVLVHMTRHKIEKVLWEEQNTYVETHMEWEVVGTGHIE